MSVHNHGLDPTCPERLVGECMAESLDVENERLREEVSRLWQECCDRECTEQDVRARLADAENALAKVRAAVFADIAATLNDHADQWEQDGSDPCRVRICREFANAYRTYAEGVGVPAMDTLRRKRREAEARLESVAALLRCPCGADHEMPEQFSIRSADLRAALDGTP